MKNLLRILILCGSLSTLGCLSGKSFEGLTPAEPPCNPGSCTITATADKTIDEGVLFEYDFTPSINATAYYVTNGPSWLAVDKTGSRVYGVPSGSGTYTDVKISAYNDNQTEVFGPFDITISGSDPLAQYAWHLNNIGQKTFSRGSATAGMDINLPEALGLGYTGDGVRVAVSDSGVEIAHEDLTDNILVGENRDYRLGSPYLGDPTPTDPDDGHGTSVAGLVAATGWNSIGSRGVAPEALLAGFYFIGSNPTSIETLDQAEGNFDIFNYSYGYPQCGYAALDLTYRAQIIEGVTTQRTGKGSIYVKSAGNDFLADLVDCGAPDSIPYYGNSNYDSDNTLPYIIVVGAYNAAGNRSSYSSPGANLWVSAPGGEFGVSTPAMLTTDLTGCSMGFAATGATANTFETSTSLNPNCKYTSAMNGTSSAAPVTSGVVALMLEANPNLTWRDVKDILARTAIVGPSGSNTTHPGGLNLSGYTYQQGWVRNAAGNYFHNWFGFGKINAQAAVETAASTSTYLPELVVTVPYTYPTTDQWYYNATGLSLTIPDRSATGVTSTISVLHNLVIEAVQVNVDITHDYASDVGIEITSPSGTKSILQNINSQTFESNISHTYLSNAFYGESSRGTWTLKVIDGYQADIGIVNSWKINVFGHVDPNPTDVTAPNPVTSLNVPATFASATATPTVTWTASNSSDFMRHEYSIGTTSGDDDVRTWQSVGANASATATGLTLSDGVTYYINVRAIDRSENISTVVTGSWLADF